MGPFNVPNLVRYSVISVSSACSGVRLRVTSVNWSFRLLIFTMLFMDNSGRSLVRSTVNSSSNFNSILSPRWRMAFTFAAAVAQRTILLSSASVSFDISALFAILKLKSWTLGWAFVFAT